MMDEFRSTNIALQKQLDEQRKRYEGIDPDEVRKLEKVTSCDEVEPVVGFDRYRRDLGKKIP